MAAQSLLRLLRHTHTHTHTGRQKQFRSRYLKEEEMSVSRRISRLSHQDKILSSLLSPLITSLYHATAFLSLLPSLLFRLPPLFLERFLFLRPSFSLICISELPFSNISLPSCLPSPRCHFFPAFLFVRFHFSSFSLSESLCWRWPRLIFLLHGLSADDKWLGAA